MKTLLLEERDLREMMLLWRISRVYLDEAVDIPLSVEMLLLKAMLLVGCKEVQLSPEHRGKVGVLFGCKEVQLSPEHRGKVGVLLGVGLLL